MNYTITYDDGKVKQSGECPAPDRLPQPGDIYEFTETVLTLSGTVYNPGDRLEIVERTTDAPHHRTSSLGNLRIKCKTWTSVWTNVEWSIADGRLKLVE